MCPYCNETQQYTDPNLQVRCVRCFNHVDGTPGIPIGRLQDLDAPMLIHLADGTTKTYAGAFTHWDRA
jgi:hypothetical protein